MTKRFLMIVVLGLLFISIGLSNPTRVEADTKERLLKSMEEHAKTLPKKGWFEKQWDKLPDLPNPGRYLEKKKECKEEADRADTVYDGKRRYKRCMDYYGY